ncbi:hypothetical protein Q8G50_29230, partial [Klebsiella pneumoniae]
MTLLSKDFIVLLIIFPFISFSRTNRGLLLWSFIALIYAYFFRTYWILIVSLFWGIYLVLPFLRKGYSLFLIIIMALLVISFLFNNVMGVEVDSFRRSVNELRLDGNVENAKTMILPFFDSGGVFWGWINVVLTWITMM